MCDTCPGAEDIVVDEELTGEGEEASQTTPTDDQPTDATTSETTEEGETSTEDHQAAGEDPAEAAAESPDQSTARPSSRVCNALAHHRCMTNCELADRGMDECMERCESCSAEKLVYDTLTESDLDQL